MSDTEVVSPQRLHDFAYGALTAAGMPIEHARTTATAMIWADLRGLDAHGVGGKLPQCIGRIRAGGTCADPALPPVSMRPAAVTIDGQNAWGQVAAVEGMRTAIQKARSCGVGAVSMRAVSSAAALGYYPTLAIAEQMIGIVVTNGPALIPAWGGQTKLLGNQAHSIGCPAGRHFPLLFDSAMTTMSTGEMDLLHDRGELLPEGVLLDENGEPTRDPGEWTKGLLVPIGGHRGFALSLVLEILTGVLSAGPRMAPDVGHPFDFAEPQGVGMFFLAIDPEVSLPFDRFTNRVDALIDQIHASPRAPGVDRVYAPGERGYLISEERKREGIPLTPKRISTLSALAADLGVAVWT
jgi:LDH2 family malate/lactate/ureidoglycolate dehydrogenase